MNDNIKRLKEIIDNSNNIVFFGGARLVDSVISKVKMVYIKISMINQLNII